jgi:hypothetical protein
MLREAIKKIRNKKSKRSRYLEKREEKVGSTKDEEEDDTWGDESKKLGESNAVVETHAETWEWLMVTSKKCRDSEVLEGIVGVQSQAALGLELRWNPWFKELVTLL